ncbi:RES family NAD+ phosphorylase [Paraburkholderia phosphatilytica]|uniref:RES family NAD+ phosphorylase n=1 Tax=Paraburkholderia phosphatilytica TaxID=2282883 RepID=UPI000E5502EE|nr:RES family NAD+ phosphorylase [Paraburkholderia phosphatilytica]
MTVAIWRIATDTPDYTADDLSGEGAKQTGGRWNRPGAAVLYCASSIALAALETVVHWNAEGLPLNRYLVRIDVPDDILHAATTVTAAAAPVGWDAIPEGKVSLDLGDNWLGAKKSAILRVPSVIVPEEFNILVNPLHPDAVAVTACKLRKWIYDSRIRQ